MTYREQSLSEFIRRFDLKLLENYLSTAPKKESLKLKHFAHLFSDIELITAPLLIEELPQTYKNELQTEHK